MSSVMSSKFAEFGSASTLFAGWTHGAADDTCGLARRFLLSMNVILHRRRDARVPHLFLQRLERNSVFGQFRPIPVAQQEPGGSVYPEPLANRTKPAIQRFCS